MSVMLLNDLLIVFALAVAVVLVFVRLRLPTIVGFLLTGILAGPQLLGLIHAPEAVETLAELGVALLMFTIGIEFSLKDLLQIRRTMLGGGGLQVALACIMAALLAMLLGSGLTQAVVIGFLVALSSTAVVLKLLQDRGEIERPSGRVVLAMLVFQDLVAIPMMIALPLLAGASGGGQPGDIVLRGLALLGVLWVAYRYLVPGLLHLVSHTRSRELFVLCIVLICFSIAWLPDALGFSLGLGAFMAGLIVSASDYNHEALGRIQPFRDVFVSLFFISIGMLLDVHYFLAHPAVVVALSLAVMLIKAAAGAGASLTLGYPVPVASAVGLALAQVGEFSFILAGSSQSYGLINAETYQLFLAVSIATMILTPLALELRRPCAELLLKLPFSERLRSGLDGAEPEYDLTDHLIIVGYGVNGRNVALAARTVGIEHVVIELNPETVRRERRRGRPIFYGDANQEAVLQHAGILRARIVVVAIPDLLGCRQITALAKRLNPEVHLLVRTRYLREVPELYALGADEVIPEEFETSIEIFSRVMERYLVAIEDVERLTDELRADGYRVLRQRIPDSKAICELGLSMPDFKIEVHRLEAGSPLVGRSLGESEIGRRYRVSVLAVRRDGEYLLNPGAEDRFEAGDEVVLAGQLAKLDLIRPAFRA